MLEIEQVGADVAEELCRKITNDLPEYFGLPQANEHYVQGMRSRVNLAVKLENKYVGLISIDFPYPNNSNIYWMAILKAFHGQGVGAKLIIAACNKAQEHGATSMTVETLAPNNSDANYLKTYKFYQANGFDPLFNLKPQGYEWDMVYMVRVLVKNIQSKSYA
jgi:GNAT superfamily N-acetyltransferase